jgi:ribonucleoside-diphosphate reductase alpha chain
MSAEAIQTVGSGYLLPGETVYGAYHRVASTAAKLNQDPDLEEDLFYCLDQGWLGLASPVFANFGAKRGYPISCYSVDPHDSTASIYSHKKEVAMLSKNGGGVGVNFSRIRPTGSPISGGGTSTGVLGWMQEYDLTARKVSQGGKLRKGSFALYLRADHPDMLEVLRAKDHTSGDPREWLDSNIGAICTDDFMRNVLMGEGHDFEIFCEILNTREMSGSPYLLFIDNVNKRNPRCYVERGLEVSLSNLCTEITGYTDENHSFVCVLSSQNLAKYGEWRNWVSPRTGRSLPELGIHLLEAVTTEFINKAKGETGMGRSVRFAEKSRMLGLGTMGLHTLYQLRGLPFASEGARLLNIEVHKFCKEMADKASRELAERFGEPEWCVGSGFRHSHRIAIAPTRTNSVICGAFSQGIEPMESNLYVAKQDKGAFLRKNPVLEKLIDAAGIPNSVWKDIQENKGSIQNLPYFTDEEKEIFLTAREIPQEEIIRQAVDRQEYVDQAQSVNLFSSSETSTEDLFKWHVSAWANGLKSLYYLRSKSAITRFNYDVPDEDVIVITKQSCPYCIKLKALLKARGVDYSEVDHEVAKEQGMWDQSWTTVPQLYIGGSWIGGYDEYLQHNVTLNESPQEEETNDCVACEA